MYTEEYSTFVKLKSRCGKLQYFVYKKPGGGGGMVMSLVFLTLYIAANGYCVHQRLHRIKLVVCVRWICC
jgi:hypothetical protein